MRLWGGASFGPTSAYAGDLPCCKSPGYSRSGFSGKMNKDTTIDMSAVSSRGGFDDFGDDDGFGSTQAGQESSLQFQSFDDDSLGGDAFAGNPDEEPMLDEPVQDDFNPDSEYPIYRLNFYRKYFNVETKEVGARLRRAVFPLRVDFLDSVHSKPDLYGPFWTVTTLVFLVGVCGNINDRISGRVPATGSEFEKISAAASFLYTYHSGIPFLLWLYARTRMEKVDVSLIEFICLFGYAHVIYVPVAVLCIIQHEWVRWFGCAVGFAMSTLLLYQSLMPIFRSNKRHLPILGGVLLAQIGFVAALKLYFFPQSAS